MNCDLDLTYSLEKTDPYQYILHDIQRIQLLFGSISVCKKEDTVRCVQLQAKCQKIMMEHKPCTGKTETETFDISGSAFLLAAATFSRRTADKV